MPALTVTAARVDDDVILKWTVTNTTDQSIWLDDQLLTHADGAAAIDPIGAVIRSPPAENAPLRVTVGYTPPYTMPMVELLPIVRALPAGGSATGGVRLSVPLASHHPMETDGQPITPRPEITVAVGYFTSTPRTTGATTSKGEVRMLAHASIREQRWLEHTVAWPVR